MMAGLLLVAVGSALVGSVGVLLNERRRRAPNGLARHPLRSTVNLLGSKWWTVGWLVALGAWVLHVGALSLAPLSTVQAVISGGLVLPGAPVRHSRHRDQAPRPPCLNPSDAARRPVNADRAATDARRVLTPPHGACGSVPRSWGRELV
jgi:hypothetical protein